ncbi:MAG: type II secretion system protein GspM [Pseudomonadota bacterium]
MMAWWTAREAREQLLIIVAAILAVAVALFQFGLIPSATARDRAERAYANALAENADVRKAAARRVKTADAASRNEPLQTVVTNTSDLYGMTITRLLPAENDGLNLWLESEYPQTVFAWLTDLETNHGVRVGKASLRRNSDEQTVSVNVYLARGG